jgi:hypothetical protein
MRGRKTSIRVVLTAEERSVLEQRLRSTTTSLGLARRCRAILQAANGIPIVARVGFGRDGYYFIGPLGATWAVAARSV